MSSQAATQDDPSTDGLTPNQRKKLRKLRSKLGKRSSEVNPPPPPPPPGGPALPPPGSIHILQTVLSNSVRDGRRMPRLRNALIWSATAPRPPQPLDPSLRIGSGNDAESTAAEPAPRRPGMQ